MTILILGAASQTGRKVVDEAIRLGHKVHAIVSDPAKLIGSGAVVFEGTPYNQQDVAKAMVGCDAVIDTLTNSSKNNNPWGKLTSPKDFLSISLCHVVREMRNNSISRLISLSKIGVDDSRKELPFFSRLIMRFSNLKWIFSDHSYQELRLHYSGLNWSVVRAPKVTDQESNSGILVRSDKALKLKESISRTNVAQFLLNTLENGNYIKETVAISNS